MIRLAFDWAHLHGKPSHGRDIDPNPLAPALGKESLPTTAKPSPPRQTPRATARSRHTPNSQTSQSSSHVLGRMASHFEQLRADCHEPSRKRQLTDERQNGPESPGIGTNDVECSRRETVVCDPLRAAARNGAVTASAPQTMARPRYSVSSNGPMAPTVQSYAIAETNAMVLPTSNAHHDQGSPRRKAVAARHERSCLRRRDH